MPSIDLLIPFLAATLLFAFFPGPALLYTAAQTLSRGRRAGFFAALGIHAGGYAHVLGATLGLSAILAHVPTLYLALKLAGAGYLVWLGIGMIWARRPSAAELPEMPRRSARRAFAESVIVELLNPKAALFFLAFLPQFVDPAAAWPVWLQFLVLGTFVNAMFTAADLLTVLFTDRVVRAVRASGAGERIARTAAGATLIGLGAHLAASRAP